MADINMEKSYNVPVAVSKGENNKNLIILTVSRYGY